MVAGPRPQRRAHVRTRGDRLQGPVAVQLPDQRQGTGEREARPGRPGPALRGLLAYSDEFHVKTPRFLCVLAEVSTVIIYPGMGPTFDATLLQTW